MIYLDHASTSYPTKYFAKDYYIPGNPNSPNALGLQANQALNEARQRIMDCLGVKSGKVLFCRCATEAVEWLANTIEHRQSPRYYVRYCSPYEHDSVALCCAEYSNEQLKRYQLYLHQYVNQITGTVFPIESIGKKVQSTGAFFGSDFTAAIGHYPLVDNLDSFCDSVWFSGHKFGCEPGIGAIWLSNRLFKYLGGDEDSRSNYGLLHGTPNVSAAVAMSYAVEHAVNNIKSKQENWAYLLEYLKVSLYSLNIEADIFDAYGKRTRAINAITFPGINADALTNFLSSHGIYISPGHSACSSNATDATRVLEAFRLTKEQASQTVRVSFSEDTTQEDIDALVQSIVEFKNLFI